MKKTLLIITTLFTLTNCSDKNKTVNISQAKDATFKFTLTPSPQTNEPSKPNLDLNIDPGNKKIISFTDTVYSDGSQKLDFKTPHGTRLGILTPENKYFFIIKNFANNKNLEIIPKIMRATYWGAKPNEVEIVFKNSGLYKVVLDNGREPAEIVDFYYDNRTRTK
jgi:hypothetical protein